MPTSSLKASEQQLDNQPSGMFKEVILWNLGNRINNKLTKSILMVVSWRGRGTGEVGRGLRGTNW